MSEELNKPCTVQNFMIDKEHEHGSLADCASKFINQSRAWFGDKEITPPSQLDRIEQKLDLLIAALENETHKG